jgi:hypothetical protein
MRTANQKARGNNPDAVAVTGDKGLLIAGRAAPQQGPSKGVQSADTALAVGATVVGVGAVGAGAAVAATNPDLISGAASGIGHLAAGAAGAIGSFFN